MDAPVEEVHDKMHEGYLVVGDQKKVDGGLTLAFPKRNKYYFVLMKYSDHSYCLQGFKDEKAFNGKRRSSSNIGSRKSLVPSLAPNYMLTSSVKVHCMDMQIGRHTNHVLIIMNGTFPNYFKSLKDKDMKPWQKAFQKVSAAMETRNTIPEVVVSPADTPKEKHASIADSGHGSHSSTPRSSQSSFDSRLSFSSCPPSPSLVPEKIMIDLDIMEQEDDIDEHGDGIAPMPAALASRRTLTKSVIMRRKDRKNSIGEEVLTFQEAPSSIYDTHIRNSFVMEDDEEDAADGPMPKLPPKSHYPRHRRVSEPLLQVPPHLLCTPDERPYEPPNRAQSVQRERNPSGPGSERSDPTSPPLPPRPTSPLPSLRDRHTYQNVRKHSQPADIEHMRQKAQKSMEQANPLFEENGKVRMEIEFLAWQQSKDKDGNTIVFSKSELLDTLVLVTIENCVWVAGWKKDLNSQLYGKLHVGDQVSQINNQVVTSADLAMEFIRSTANDDISITLYRLPHAKLFELQRSSSDIQWGIELKSSCNNEIKAVHEGPAQIYGMSSKASRVLSKKDCDWIITEISQRPVPIVKSGQNQKFVKEEIASSQNKLPLVIQPSDFVKKLAEALHALPKKQSALYY